MDSLFPEYFNKTNDQSTLKHIHYISNLCYCSTTNQNNTIYPETNEKFPGTIAIPIQRRNIKYNIHGGRPFYIPYKEAHIFPWLAAFHRHVPVMTDRIHKLPAIVSIVEPIIEEEKKNSTSLFVFDNENIRNLDFGTNEGLFLPKDEFVEIEIASLDFGNHLNLFIPQCPKNV